MTVERTFLAVKPDGVQRGLSAEIIGRFERKGFKLVGLKLMHVTRQQAETHYAEHNGKPFFEGLVSYITQAPIVAMAFETLAAQRVELISDAENAASRRVAERCGFALEGLLRRERRAPDGSLRDTCVYAKLAG